MANFKVLKMEQGSPEWHTARLGKVTASKFSKIITAKTMKTSASAEEIINMAVAEHFTGEPTPVFITDAMVRGNELEPQAFGYFNLAFDLGLESIGFVVATDEDGNDLNFGCSPDGINFEKGLGAEFKCPLAHNHLAYLAEGKLPDKYYQQVQGTMAILGLKKYIFGSYHPSFPALKVEVERDEKFCQKILETLNFCHQEIEARKNKLNEIMEVSKAS